MGLNIHLRFPTNITTEPIVCKLSRLFDLEFSITRADISERRVGYLILELRGSDTECQKGVQYLRNQGVEVTPVEKYIVRDTDKCVECGMCTAICPTSALRMNTERRLMFDKENCIVCAMCTKICPLQALSVTGGI